MRILTWNLNHRSGKHPYSKWRWVAEVVLANSPDVAVFTEFTERPEHEAFRSDLDDAGWCHSLSNKTRDKNRVLIATREPHSEGVLRAPSITEGVPESFHHVVLDRCGTHILGFRMLEQTKQGQFTAAKKREVWEWLLSVVCEYRDVPAILGGDFNAPPENEYLRLLVKLGWERAASDPGAFSFAPDKLIDHVFLSPSFVRTQAEALCDWSFESQLGGKSPSKGDRLRGMPDHAMVIVDIK